MGRMLGGGLGVGRPGVGEFDDGRLQPTIATAIYDGKAVWTASCSSLARSKGFGLASSHTEKEYDVLRVLSGFLPLSDALLSCRRYDSAVNMPEFYEKQPEAADDVRAYVQTWLRGVSGYTKATSTEFGVIVVLTAIDQLMEPLMTASSFGEGDCNRDFWQDIVTLVETDQSVPGLWRCHVGGFDIEEAKRLPPQDHLFGAVTSVFLTLKQLNVYAPLESLAGAGKKVKATGPSVVHDSYVGGGAGGNYNNGGGSGVADLPCFLADRRGVLHPDGAVNCTCRTARRSRVTIQGRAIYYSTPDGEMAACLGYHTNGRCTHRGCRFSHWCVDCRAKHPMIQSCPRRPRTPSPPPRRRDDDERYRNDDRYRGKGDKDRYRDDDRERRERR
jgi:hypothetical protein